jgi:hypothetical protein
MRHIQFRRSPPSFNSLAISGHPVFVSKLQGKRALDVAIWNRTRSFQSVQGTVCARDGSQLPRRRPWQPGTRVDSLPKGGCALVAGRNGLPDGPFCPGCCDQPRVAPSGKPRARCCAGVVAEGRSWKRRGLFGSDFRRLLEVLPGALGVPKPTIDMT